MTKWCDKCQVEEPTMKAIYTEASEGSQWRLDEWVQYLCDECYDDLTERVREGNIFSLIGHELTHEPTPPTYTTPEGFITWE